MNIYNIIVMHYRMPCNVNDSPSWNRHLLNGSILHNLVVSCSLRFVNKFTRLISLHTVLKHGVRNTYALCIVYHCITAHATLLDRAWGVSTQISLNSVSTAFVRAPLHPEKIKRQYFSLPLLPFRSNTSYSDIIL